MVLLTQCLKQKHSHRLNPLASRSDVATNLANMPSDRLLLEQGIPPTWAAEWGEDQFGPFCSIEIHEVVQRLRWIHPGTCFMGSPAEEEGRYEDEGPRHLVTIESGFWIFDTPCTQALWHAVMGTNPSRFQEEQDLKKTADHPVERVNWDDCQEFLGKLNEKLPGLDLSLPSEAQWEYACRAGTDGARYRENLDEICWYSQNSEGTTHPVGGKEANAFGLYDMLGNVWEWCADNWTEDYSEAARAAASSARVIRGASWGVDAHRVRAACRASYEPTNRSFLIGCRLAEFRAGVVS